MKKCSFCGKEYPDDATVCAIDGESLSGLVADRKKVTGVWRGVYAYGNRAGLAGIGPVAFTLKLKQGWIEHFTGSVTEDAPRGTPGIGIIDGYFNFPTIEFTKQMPVGYVIKPDGTLMTLREHIVANGHQCERDLPSAPIFSRELFWVRTGCKAHGLSIPSGFHCRVVCLFQQDKRQAFGVRNS